MIIVEDVPLELKGTEGIFKTDIPEAEIIGTAEMNRLTGDLSRRRSPTSYCSIWDWAVLPLLAWKSAAAPSSSIPT